MKRLFVVLACTAASTFAQQTDSQWSATGSLLTARRDACLAPLHDGRVVVAGGVGIDGTLSATEIYADPFFEPAPAMAMPRSSHACTLLSDGRVLTTGGRNGDSAVIGAEIFDPAEGAWSAAANEPLARWGHTATLLPDGTVLLAGGETLDGPVGALERFDPIMNTFSTLASVLAVPRTFHIAAVLSDGRVLIAGGRNGDNDLDSTEIVEPFGDSVAIGPSLTEPRAALASASLVDGRILLIGGSSAGADLGTSLIFEPITSNLTAGPNLRVARTGAQAIRIPNNGNVLVIGGTIQGVPTGSTEFYDAVQNEFLPFGELTLAREGLGVAAIGDSGAILAAGGAVNGVPVAACGKTGTPSTLVADKAIYIVGDAAVITGNWGIQKESISLTIRLTSPGGDATFQTIGTSNLTGTFTVTSNPLIGPGTAVVTATGATSHISLSTTFQVQVSSTLSFQTPVSPSLLKTPVTISVRLHQASGTNTPPAGNFTLKDGSATIATASTFGTTRFIVNSAGDLLVDFQLPNGFSSIGIHNLTGQFQSASSGFVASSSTTAPLPFVVNGRSARITAAVDSPPARIQGVFNFRVSARSTPGFPEPTGFVSVSEGSSSLGRFPLITSGDFGRDPANFAVIQIVSGTNPRVRTLRVLYEGDSNYAPETLTPKVDVRGLIPNLRIDSVVPDFDSNTFSADGLAQANITFTPVAGVDPFLNPACVIPACIFRYQWIATIQQNGLDVGSGDVELTSFNNSDVNGSPIVLHLGFLALRAVGPATVTVRMNCDEEQSGDFDFRTNYDCLTLPPFSFNVATKGNPQLDLRASVATAAPNRTAKIAVTAGGRSPSGTFQLFEGTSLIASTQVPLSPTFQATNFAFTVPTTAGTHTYAVLYSGDVSWVGSSATVVLQVP